MAKVAKADGKVGELEAEILKHTFTDISTHFENSQEVRDGLKIAGVCIISIETKKVSIDKAKIILKLNVDDEVDINDILSEITYIDEVTKVEVIG